MKYLHTKVDGLVTKAIGACHIWIHPLMNWIQGLTDWSRQLLGGKEG